MYEIVRVNKKSIVILIRCQRIHLTKIPYSIYGFKISFHLVEDMSFKLRFHPDTCMHTHFKLNESI